MSSSLIDCLDSADAFGFSSTASMTLIIPSHFGVTSIVFMVVFSQILRVMVPFGIASVILILVTAVKFLVIDTFEFYQSDFTPIINNSFGTSLVLTMSVALGGYLYWKNMVIIDPIERNMPVILLVTVNILSVVLVSASLVRLVACSTVEVISSRAEAVSSKEAACC